MILYNKYFRLHGHIADLLVPSKTNMEELLQMCTFPKRSGRLSLYYHHHGTRGVLQSMTMIILYHHHHYNAQGGDVEVHIRQKMGGGNGVNIMKPLPLA